MAAGTLIVVGGHEDREDQPQILEEIVRRAGKGRFVVTTVASASNADALAEEYRAAFAGLGVRDVVHLDVGERVDATDARRVACLDRATAVFFTGGDQLRITSLLGDTPVFQRIQEIYRKGGLVAGTSAGASAMSTTMLVSGPSDTTPRLGDVVAMAPGLGLLDNVILDQHFAERGRLGRLVAAVAQNPANLGVGIDENTAIVVEGGRRFRVVGCGGVYVLDARDLTRTNIVEATDGTPVAAYDIRLHLLARGDTFDLATRRPGGVPAEVAEQVTKAELASSR